MENLFALLLFASLIFLVIGLFKPATSLFWDKNEKTRKKSFLVYGGLTILFFILFGVTADKKKTGSSDTSSLTTETQTAENAQVSTQAEKERELAEIKKNTISAHDLTATYEANEVAADENFKGKTFYVTGTITDIKKDVLDNIYVTLKGNEMFRQVQCFFEDKETAAQMHKGMKVTFKGTCDGLMINVLMKDCVLVQ
ncbi:OB-fold protein [Mucilaginibacter arboris]|nr:hypothetical protein [Mucilaginibacter arboris]